MDRPPIDSELFRNVLATSFEQPLCFSGEVNKLITRNRSVSSSRRRYLKDLLFRSIRWRRRLWGDILPTVISLDSLESKLSEAESLKENPPLSRWNTLSLDTLSREMSYPTWLVELCVHQYGLSEAVKLLLSLNDEAPTTLRVNTLKTTREKLIEAFEKKSIEFEIGRNSPWAIHLKQRVNIRSLKAFKEGCFEMQDEGSQISVLETGAEKGMTVVDACAGAGGKSLALAAMMENQGRIFALDSDSRPLEELAKRGKRAGCTILEPQWVAKDETEPLSGWENRVDVVVVDAPCSSLGTLRRRPWLKWHYTKSMVATFPKQQLALLKKFSRLVREGGCLHYITCTIHPLENQEVIATFSRDDPRFKETGNTRLLRPDAEGTDGFFVATLRR